MKRKFEYYTPEQSTQFAFYHIPQVLFLKKEFSILSANAKLLYGLLLDRLNLSIKNGWIDKNNHAYISMKITTISKMIECSEKKCSQLLTQLEEIGLIKRVSQGFGRPSRLYVMNFIKKENSVSDHRKYDYFSLEESQQFNFYRIPKVLFTDAKYFLLSTDAKILYGLLLDRMGLSFQYKWVDNENHTYIYFKGEEAENLLRCSKRKVSSLFSELKKVGLIQQQKQGLNKPTRIYVMDFVSNISLTKVINKNIPCVKACRKLKSGSRTQNLLSGHVNFTDTDVQNLPTGHANFTDRDMQNLPIGRANSTAMDVQNLPIGHANFTAMNNTNYINTNISNTDLKQQQTIVVAQYKKKLSFIKESLSDFEIKKILETANYDIDLIKEKYQVMENQNINNVVGFLLTAIKRDFRPPQKKVKENRFVNYEQRTDWDFEELQKLEQERLRQDAANDGITEAMIEKFDTDIKQNEIRTQIDYQSLLLSFPHAKEKIDKLVKILAVLLLDHIYTFLIYDNKFFSKNTALNTVKNLNYNSMTDMLANHFDDSVHSLFLKLSTY